MVVNRLHNILPVYTHLRPGCVDEDDPSHYLEYMELLHSLDSAVIYKESEAIRYEYLMECINSDMAMIPDNDKLMIVMFFTALTHRNYIGACNIMEVIYYHEMLCELVKNNLELISIEADNILERYSWKFYPDKITKLMCILP